MKDWASWETHFREAELERIDNGMLTRTYGHDAKDKNLVRLVMAILYTAKARVYRQSWQTDTLQKEERQEESLVHRNMLYSEWWNDTNPLYAWSKASTSFNFKRLPLAKPFLFAN